MKGVIRISSDAHRTHGYQGRVYWQERQYTKFFSDELWGGQRRAKKVCAAWVREKEQALGKPVTDRPVRSKPGSATGVVGVNLVRDGRAYLVTVVNRKGKQLRYYVAWGEGSQVVALRKARKLRETLMRKHYPEREVRGM